MSNYGTLLNKDTILQRKYFSEMCRLRGIRCIYQYPIVKDYSWDSDLEANYSNGEELFCILNENVDQKTCRKLGWVSELTDNVMVLSVPYDLKNIQLGCLFSLPPAIEGAEYRKFRVVEMSTTAIYPSSVACRIVPYIQTTVEHSQYSDFHSRDLNLLNGG